LAEWSLPPGRASLQRIFETGHGENRTLSFVEGLRGFAMLNIYLIHFISNFYYWLAPGTLTFRWTSAQFTISHSSVDLFFLLSGYLTYRSFIQHPRPYLGYLGGRVRRIYPVFLTIFAVYVGLSFAAPSISKIPAQPREAALYLLANLLLLPGLFPIQPMISVAWGLSYEMFSYLSLPLLAKALRRAGTAWRILAAVGLTAGLVAAAFGSETVPVRLTAFLAGAVVYDLQSAARRWKLPASLGLFAIPGLYGVIWLLPITPAGLAWRAVANFIGLGLLMFEPLDQPNGLTARVFSWTPLRWFGNISYSYFLVHGLVIRIEAYLLAQVYPPQIAPPVYFWLGLILSFPLTVIAALGLYLLVERPAQAWLARRV